MKIHQTNALAELNDLGEELRLNADVLEEKLLQIPWRNAQLLGKAREGNAPVILGDMAHGKVKILDRKRLSVAKTSVQEILDQRDASLQRFRLSQTLMHAIYRIAPDRGQINHGISEPLCVFTQEKRGRVRIELDANHADDAARGKIVIARVRPGEKTIRFALDSVVT